MHYAKLLVLFAILAACAHSPMDDQPAAAAQLAFTVTGALQASGPDSVRISGVAPGEAVIDGVLSAPNPCYRIHATLAEEAGSLTVRLVATSGGGMCAQVIAGYTYEASITDLAPGTYSIVVVHTYPSTGWEERTYRLTAEVP